MEAISKNIITILTLWVAFIWGVTSIYVTYNLSQREDLTVLMTYLGGNIMNVTLLALGYYYTTTQNSKAKDTTISELSKL